VLPHISKEMLPCEVTGTFWNHCHTNQCVHGQSAPISQEMLPQVPWVEDMTGMGRVSVIPGVGGMNGAGGQESLG